jgi:malate:Na+ symporter
MSETNFDMAETAAKPGTGFLAQALGLRIGPLPAPLYLALAVLTICAAITKRLPNDLTGGLMVLMLMGFLLSDLGRRIPVLRQIGGTAILCLFVPSALIGYKLLDPTMVKAIHTTFVTANMQYLYIACLVAGSILGMDRKVLVQGFLRMFVPLVVGTLGAVVAGILVGLAFGYSPFHTFFFIVIPILGGGLGEGVLPVSLGYSQILNQAQAPLVAMMVPAALLGNVVAIIASGMLRRFGERNPSFSGQGRLVRGGDDLELLGRSKAQDMPIDIGLMGAGLLLSCSFYVLGLLLAPVTGIPGPVLMIICAALLKVSKLIPARMELGAYQMYSFISTNLTSAILVAMGAVLVSWPQLVSAFSISYFVICAATVAAMIAAGFFVGIWLKMYPVESALVTACHSGLGGTGDVAILSASDRMVLMPFSQISTRIGGAAMIVVATLLMKLFH